MENKLKGNPGAIVITLLAYIFMYNLFIFDFIKKSPAFNDTLQIAMTITDITITNIHIFLIIIVAITSTFICFFNFLLYKIFCNICAAKSVSSSKLLLATVISLFPGLIITYFISLYGLVSMNSILAKIINTFCNTFIICLLISEDMDKKQLIKFILLASAYGIINLIISICIIKPF